MTKTNTKDVTHLSFTSFLRCWFIILLLERFGRFFLFTGFGWNSGFDLVSFSTTLILIAAVFTPGNKVVSGLAIISHSFVVWNIKESSPNFIPTIIPFLTHWFLAFAVDVVIITAFIRLALQKKRNFTMEEVGYLASPAIRLIFIITLTSAGFAKINVPFMHSQVSCVSAFMIHLQQKFQFLSVFFSIESIFPYLIVFAEFIAPSLLFVTIFRPLASLSIWVLMFGLGFVPSPNTLYDFAGLYLCMIILFQPVESVEWVNTNLRKVISSTCSKLNQNAQKLIHISASYFFGIFFIYVELLKQTSLVDLFIMVTWSTFGLYVLSILLRSCYLLYTKSHTFLNWSFKRIGVVASLWVMLIFAKESLVYLGAPHNSNFNMASGLALSRIYSNHLIIRKLPDLGFNRVATVVESNDPRLVVGRRYPWHGVNLYLKFHSGRRVMVNIEGDYFVGPHNSGVLSDISNLLGLPILLPHFLVDYDPVCKVHTLEH